MLRLPFTLCVFLVAAVSVPARGQTGFQEKAQAAVSGGKLFSVLNLTATAEWTAGSTHETGTAQLQAKIDGSANVQLSLGQTSRTETQTAADSARTCAWTDNAGTSHEVVGANCFVAIPWFAPGLFTQASSQLPSLLGVTDNGVVPETSSTLHKMSFVFNQQGMDSVTTAQLTERSTVKVFYDPQTYLPVALEYNIHPDNNDLQNIPVSVVFSNYQSVSGMMVPFHIEKYVNRSLQLTLNVSNATTE
jgi:hypothetical protein